MRDEAECSLCGACAVASPSGAIFNDQTRDKYLKRGLCAGRPEGALCVERCPVWALTLGREHGSWLGGQSLDLDRTSGEVSTRDVKPYAHEWLGGRPLATRIAGKRSRRVRARWNPRT